MCLKIDENSRLKLKGATIIIVVLVLSLNGIRSNLDKLRRINIFDVLVWSANVRRHRIARVQSDIHPSENRLKAWMTVVRTAPRFVLWLIVNGVTCRYMQAMVFTKRETSVKRPCTGFSSVKYHLKRLLRFAMIRLSFDCSNAARRILALSFVTFENVPTTCNIQCTFGQV